MVKRGKSRCARERETIEEVNGPQTVEKSRN